MLPRPPSVKAVGSVETGFWRVVMYPNGRSDPRDLTMFRTIPTQIGSMSWTDPSGPAEASLVFPAVSVLERPGVGDLDWLRPEVDVDIEWVEPKNMTVVHAWEGFTVSFDWSSDSGVSVSCQGALRQLDHFLAVPESLYQPLPYEKAIARQFDDKPSLRVAKIVTELHEGKSQVFDMAKYKGQPQHLIPSDLKQGDRWTGMLTRETGNFSRVLSEYIEGLLSNMHTDIGRYTIRLRRGRVPVLMHSTRLLAPRDDTIVISALQPGVRISGSTDYSQRINVVYASGQTMRGIVFNGMNVSADGLRTWFEPYAHKQNTHPTEDNPELDKNAMRRELLVEFSGGIDEEEAARVAESQLHRNSDPGFVGTIELSTDGRSMDGRLIPRQTIVPGDSILVTGVFGTSERANDGLLARITEVTQTMESTSLTIDTKYRDYLTVQEVRSRTRDALAPIRIVTPGSFTATIKDGLFPWSYALGSGVIPRPPDGTKHIFTDMPDSEDFPWLDWVAKHPPYILSKGKAQKTKWHSHYIRIGPTSSNANINWASRSSSHNVKDFKPWSVRMSASGNARQIQVAAFNRYGKPLKVPFHISLWRESGINHRSMPLLSAQVRGLPYRVGEAYPFATDAFETQKATGQLVPKVTGQAAATIIAGWGTFAEKAGFSPGSSSNGDMPTGRLETNTTFPWDAMGASGSGSAARVDPNRTPAENLRLDSKGVADFYVMLYCDAQMAQEVYFLGRILRQEPTGA